MFIGEERVPFNTCSIHFLLRPMYSAQKIQNGGTIVVIKRNCRVGLWKKRVSWIQKIMMTFLSWRRLQPIWDAIFPKNKVFMKIFCRDIDKLIGLMNLKATPGWFEGLLKLCAEKYKPQEELLNDTHLKQLLWKGTEADKGHELSLPSCRFRVVASKLSLLFLEGYHSITMWERGVGVSEKI